ncbi:hypothetical protein [Cellulomonas sp. JZ18]|uniref:hypothetical protein n=1 Tax=Cellulomonas sp. JZ18 TaxID=2654191 RepID=UPI001E552723|nr:hypothetical protein [Cellulomonas sp. JZ18]
MALAVALLTPNDPRGHPRRLARAAVHELAGMLHAMARGLGRVSADDIEGALLTGRASQPALDEWLSSSRAAVQLARLAPAHRRHRPELERQVDTAVLLDRAMRNARVLARRARRTVADAHEAPALAEVLEQVARATDDLAAAVAVGADPRQARERLLSVAAGLDPHVVARDDWQVQSLVLLVRSLVVDLLEASGATPGQAREALPEL